MHAHYLQHVLFEGPGSIAPWLKNAGFEQTRTAFFEFNNLPNPDTIDFLVVMGGSMSVNDENEHPWLVEEKDFIRSVISTGKPVLGICLGAQLIASTCGARVFPNPEKEIGWFPVEGVTTGDAGYFRFPTAETVFHWHGETFELPDGAVCLARSATCGNQAFQLGKNVIGLQFHLETTPESALAIVEHCGHELEPARYVQDKSDILSVNRKQYEIINRLMGEVLAFLLQDKVGK